MEKGQRGDSVLPGLLLGLLPGVGGPDDPSTGALGPVGAGELRAPALGVRVPGHRGSVAQARPEGPQTLLGLVVLEDERVLEGLDVGQPDARPNVLGPRLRPGVGLALQLLERLPLLSVTVGDGSAGD